MKQCMIEVYKLLVIVKKLFILFLCLFVGMVPGLCQEEEIPAWFLVPSVDEYVGVSLPLELVSQRENSALAVALLSYFAVHPGKVKVPASRENDWETVYDNGKSRQTVNSMITHVNGETEERSEERFVRTLTQKLDYRIVRRFENKRGELFIAIQVQESACNAFSLSYESATQIVQQGAKTENRETASATIAYTHSGDQAIEMGMSFYVDPSQETVSLVEGKSGLTFSKKNILQSDYNYRDTRIVQLAWRSRCTCSLSLHVAYVKCLFSLLRQENRSVYRMGVFDNVLYLL